MPPLLAMPAAGSLVLLAVDVATPPQVQLGPSDPLLGPLSLLGGLLIAMTSPSSTWCVLAPNHSLVLYAIYWEIVAYYSFQADQLSDFSGVVVCDVVGGEFEATLVALPMYLKM